MIQKRKVVSGEWIISSDFDEIRIQWIAGFARAIAEKCNSILLDCQPNRDSEENLIPIYRVKIEIEAIRDEDIGLYGRVIK